MSIYLVALLLVGLLFITHLFGGWKKEYFQGKFLATIKRNFLKSFFVGLISLGGVVLVTEGLQRIYPPVFEYSFSFTEPSESSDTISTDEEGNWIQTAEDGTQIELGLTKNWGLKKVLTLVNWMLIFYLLPLFCFFMTSHGSTKTKGIDYGSLAFYIIFLFFVGNSIASIIAWLLLFSFYGYRNSKVANKFLDEGLSHDKVDEKFKEIVAPYVFWFMVFALSCLAYLTLLF